MRARIFWKLGLTYLALLLGVLLAVGFYSSRVLRRDYIRSTEDKLASLLNMAKARPPRLDDPAELQAWVEWMGSSGARVTVVDNTGRVLADSQNDSETTENLSTRPDVQQAFASGEGQSASHSATQGRDLVYRAARSEQPGGSPVVIRMALPVAQIDASLSELRRRIYFASFVSLLLGGLISLIYFQGFAARVERLKDFSRRVAEGDFRPLPTERRRDELADLASALNETAAWMDRTIQSLSRERNRSSAILRSMVEGVAVIDSQERLVFCLSLIHI